MRKDDMVVWDEERPEAVDLKSQFGTGPFEVLDTEKIEHAEKPACNCTHESMFETEVEPDGTIDPGKHEHEDGCTYLVGRDDTIEALGFAEFVTIQTKFGPRKFAGNLFKKAHKT